MNHRSLFRILDSLSLPVVGGGLVSGQPSRIMMSGRTPPPGGGPSADCPPVSARSEPPTVLDDGMVCLCFTLFLPSSDNIQAGMVSGSASPSTLPKLVMVSHLPNFPFLIPLVSSLPARYA